MVTNGELKGPIFYPTLTQIMDSFSCSPLNFTFFFKLSKVSDYTEMSHKVMVPLQDNNKTKLCSGPESPVHFFNV